MSVAAESATPGVPAGADPGPLLEVVGLTKHFPIRKGVFQHQVGQVRAVDGVSFRVAPGETLCIVGESGCGKSTVGRMLLRLIEPTAGAIRLKGQDVTTLSRNAFRPLRKTIQIVFQDPFASLNPRMRAGDIVAEPLENFGDLSRAARREAVAELFGKVGLARDAMQRYAFEFSGGQRQRLGVARALALRPEIIVADEPVSALDVSVQAQVLNLMMDLKAEFGLAYVFISHDLGVVEHMADRVAVMYLGEIVEIAPRDAIFARSRHPYTIALMAAAPRPDPRAALRKKLIIEGDVPSPANPPSGCRFHTRCPHAFERCRVEVPKLRPAAPNHHFACHLDVAA